MKALIDSNVFIYAYNLNSPFQKKALEIIEYVYTGKIDAYVSDINLIEIYSVLTDARKIENPLSPEKATELLKLLLQSNKFKKVYLTKEIINNLPQKLKEFNVRQYNIYDFILYLQMQTNNIDCIITANEKDFKKFPSITVKNPFKQIKDFSYLQNQKKFIPYGKQFIDNDDINSVLEVLKSSFITQGPKISEFEEKLAKYCGAKYAVVFNSGTSALHGAYFALGLKKDDEFITSPITFVATSNAGLFLGAKPIFVDIEKDTANIDVNKIEEKLTEKTKIISVVHYAGHPVNMEKVYKIAKKYNLKVLEDACHALGAKYKDSKIGCCKYSDMTVFSFHPVKHITTGEGGAVLTNDDEFYNKLLMFRNHGITKDKDKFIKSSDGDWYYEMQFLGYNYRMTDIQASLGISQLKKLDKFVDRRREIAFIYNKAFKNNNYFDIPIEKDYAYHAYHLYPIRLKEKYIKYKKEIFSKLHQEGIGVQVHYIPVYWQPFYQNLGYKKGICPNAEDFYKRELSIPIFPAMNNDDIDKVIDSIYNVVKNYA